MKLQNTTNGGKYSPVKPVENPAYLKKIFDEIRDINEENAKGKETKGKQNGTFQSPPGRSRQGQQKPLKKHSTDRSDDHRPRTNRKEAAMKTDPRATKRTAKR